MKSVYVATSLHNAARAREIQRRFRAYGVAVSYDWTVHGRIDDPAELARVGELEEQGVRDCDLLFMIFPARSGAHCELGMARALGKHIVLLEEELPPEEKTFYHRPAAHARPIHRFNDADAAIALALSLLRDSP